MAIYTEVSISGYNNNPPPDNGTQTSDNEVTWAKHKTKLADPIKTLAEGIDDNVASAFAKVFGASETALSTQTTLTASHHGRVLSVTNTTTLDLTAAATLGDGWHCVVINADSNTKTIDPNGAETINGSATFTLSNQYDWCIIFCNGTTFKTIYPTSILALNNIFTGDNTYSGDNTFTGDMRFTDEGELTIATAAITVTAVNHTVDTESDAASDTLSTINGGVDGQLLMIGIENDAREVTVDEAGNIVTPDGQDITMSSTSEKMLLLYSGALSKWQVISVPLTAATVSGTSQFLHIRDERSSGTSAGSSSATTDHTRTLNTVRTNEITGASLATNQVTLPAGTYYYEAECPIYNSGNLSTNYNQCYLYNVTDTAEVSNSRGRSCSLNSDTSDGVTTWAKTSGRFTITGTKAIELRHYNTIAYATHGLGLAVSQGTEVYADIKIWKVG